MRFGKTKIQKYEDSERRRIARDGKWFAWHPVQLKDGNWVYLEYVYRRSLWLKPLIGPGFNYYNLKDVENGTIKTSQYRD